MGKKLQGEQVFRGNSHSCRFLFRQVLLLAFEAGVAMRNIGA